MPGTEPDRSIAAALNRPRVPAKSIPPTHSIPLDFPPGSEIHVKDVRHGDSASRPALSPPTASNRPSLSIGFESGQQVIPSNFVEQQQPSKKQPIKTQEELELKTPEARGPRER